MVTTPTTRQHRGKLSNEEALDFVRQRVSPRLIDSNRVQIEREWVKNVLFLNGNQHFISDPNGIGFFAPKLGKHRVLYRAPIIRTLMTRAVASIQSHSTRFRAPAKDWTKKSRDQAFVTEKLFEHIRENVVDWQAVQRDALFWAACCGSGFIEYGFDPNAGNPDRFYLDEDGKAFIPESEDEKRILAEQGKYEDIPPGEVVCMSRSPLQCHWDTNARRIADCAWFATKELVPISSLEDVYGYEKTKDIRPSEPDNQTLWYDELLQFMSGAGAYEPMYARNPSKDKAIERTVLVRMFHVPSRRDNFDGRYIVTAGDVVLKNGKNHAKKWGYPIPFDKLDWQHRPGSFLGHPVVEDLRNPQFQYNNARAKQTEVLNVHSHPAIFVDKRAELPPGLLSIDPGAVYQCNLAAAGGKPIHLGPTPQVPKELSESASRAMTEMQMIASQSGEDMSKYPGQVRGAAALEMLNAEKNRSLLPAAMAALSVTISGGKKLLSICKTEYTSRRTIKYVGEDNAYRVASFEAADIVDDIRISGEPDFFANKGTERAQLMEWVESGLLNPALNPEDRTIALKILGYGNAEQAIAEMLADEENQDREWDEMVGDPMAYVTQNALGEPMLDYPTQPFDNDATHLRVMTRRMKSEEWRRLDPIARQLVVQHFEEHQEKENQRMARQMAMMQAEQGRPGQKGQASKPKAKGAA